MPKGIYNHYKIRGEKHYLWKGGWQTYENEKRKERRHKKGISKRYRHEIVLFLRNGTTNSIKPSKKQLGH